jgi:hypothetical protein
MKTIFAVLLIAALGAAAYFYFSKTQQPAQADPKELIVGNWKLDSIRVTPPWSHRADSSLPLAFSVADSDLYNYQYDIEKKGVIIKTRNGKGEDTGQYDFVNDKELLLWSKTDSVKKIKWRIIKLDSLDFVIQGEDSAIISFKKVK